MRYAVIILVLVAVLGAGVYYFSKTPNDERYTNQTLGLSFSYPSEYVLQEAERGNGERRHYSIVLIRKSDSTVPENGEGPTSITIDAYQNNLDKMTLTKWLNTGVSNYKLAKGAAVQRTVAGKEAITYEWSGLYEGKTTALLHRDNVLAFSVTTLAPNDTHLAVYESVLRSLQLF